MESKLLSSGHYLQKEFPDSKGNLERSASVDFLLPSDDKALDPMKFVQPFLDQMPMVRTRLDQSIFKSQAPLSVNEVQIGIDSKASTKELSNTIVSIQKKSKAEQKSHKFDDEMRKTNSKFQKIYNERK